MGNGLFQSRAGRTEVFGQVQKISISFWGLPLPASTSLKKLVGGGLY